MVESRGGGGGAKQDAAMQGADAMNLAGGLQMLQKEHQMKGTRAELLVRQPHHKAVSKKGTLSKKQELVFYDGCPQGSRASMVKVGDAFACGGPDHEDKGMMVRLRVFLPCPVHHVGVIHRHAISQSFARQCEWGKHPSPLNCILWLGSEERGVEALFLCVCPGKESHSRKPFSPHQDCVLSHKNRCTI